MQNTSIPSGQNKEFLNVKAGGTKSKSLYRQIIVVCSEIHAKHINI
jgi:hypothetical protein